MEAVTTPASISARESDITLLSAPRALNEPVTWNSSSFITMLAGQASGSRRAATGITGVSRVKGAMRRRAAVMSASVIM